VSNWDGLKGDARGVGIITPHKAVSSLRFATALQGFAGNSQAVGNDTRLKGHTLSRPERFWPAAQQFCMRRLFGGANMRS